MSESGDQEVDRKTVFLHKRHYKDVDEVGGADVVQRKATERI